MYPAGVRIYLDNQSTTRVDARVVESMVDYMTHWFGNAGSTSHSFGWEAKEAVDRSRTMIAQAVGAQPREIIFTSGATESNNLALRGVALHPRRKSQRGHIVSVSTEHKATLDPLSRLAQEGFEVSYVPPAQHPRTDVGRVSADDVATAMRDDTFLVAIMLANNEIGTIQSLTEIGALCRERGALLFTDATQAVGKIRVDFKSTNVDLASFSAHKIYGPKGVGALFLRSGAPRVRIVPLVDGGAQEFGLRSGTLNVPGIVGFAKALELCLETLDEESQRLRALRDGLFQALKLAVPEVQLNGPALDQKGLRLSGNLNLRFPSLDGEALMMGMPEIAVSSGSACTSAEPSHVLQAIGLTEDEARSSLRISLGRFNDEEEVYLAVKHIVRSVERLRKLAK